MSKKIQGDPKPKKPFYKKIWFWVLVIVVVGAAAGGLGGSKSSSSDSSAKQSTTTKAKKKKVVKNLTVGDSAKVGKVVYTLKSVKTTSYRNEFEKKQPKNVIKVVYHVKNQGKEDLPIGTDLDVYGPDNSKLDTYPVEDTTLDSVAPGKEADVIAGFGSKKLGKFELQFKPLVSFEKAAKFEVTVK